VFGGKGGTGEVRNGSGKGTNGETRQKKRATTKTKQAPPLKTKWIPLMNLDERNLVKKTKVERLLKNPKKNRGGERAKRRDRRSGDRVPAPWKNKVVDNDREGQTKRAWGEEGAWVFPHVLHARKTTHTHST